VVITVLEGRDILDKNPEGNLSSLPTKTGTQGYVKEFN